MPMIIIASASRNHHLAATIVCRMTLTPRLAHGDLRERAGSAWCGFPPPSPRRRGPGRALRQRLVPVGDGLPLRLAQRLRRGCCRAVASSRPARSARRLADLEPAQADRHGQRGQRDGDQHRRAQAAQRVQAQARQPVDEQDVGGPHEDVGVDQAERDQPEACAGSRCRARPWAGWPSRSAPAPSARRRRRAGTAGCAGCLRTACGSTTQVATGAPARSAIASG